MRWQFSFVAIVFVVAACERASTRTREDDKHKEERPIEFKPKAFICPPGMGLRLIGWAMLPMSGPDCPSEVLLFGMGATGCAVGGSCDRPCKVVETVATGDTSHALAEWRFDYDRDGRPVALEKLDAEGEKSLSVTWTWRDGRLASQDVNRRGGRDITKITYSAGGREAEVSSDGETTAMKFDRAGRLTSDDGNSYVIEDGRTMGIRYKGREAIEAHFRYDDKGQVTAVDWPLETRSEYSYDERGLTTSERGRSSGVLEELKIRHLHDDKGRLLSSTQSVADGAIGLAYHYECPD